MQMDLTWSAISAAHTTLKRWRALVNPYRNISVANNAEVLETINKDLDTPRLISLLRSAEKDMSRTSEEKAALFLYADKVLGLDLGRQEIIKPLPNDVAETFKQREIARREKNWEESDRLRKILESNGLIIKDTAATQEWEWR